MSELRAMIVDDEPVARDYLRELLEAESVEVVAECGGGDEAVRRLGEGGVDLLFLDIRMPRVGGFDVLRALPAELRPPVVFVTAHAEHAARAFDIEAIDYLLKPYDRERLRDTLRRVRRRLTQGERIALRDGSKTLLLAPAEIAWIEAEANYVRVHTDGGSRLIRITLTELEQRLAARRFARIHRGALVNARRIVGVRPTGHGDAVVTLDCGRELTLSRRYRDRLDAVLGC